MKKILRKEFATECDVVVSWQCTFAIAKSLPDNSKLASASKNIGSTYSYMHEKAYFSDGPF